MKKISTILLIIFIAFTLSCKKDGFKKSAPAEIYLVSKITTDYSFGNHRVAKYSYDDHNRIIQTYSETYNQYETGGGNAYRFTYDSDNRLTLAEQGLPGTKALNVLKFVYTFDKPNGKGEETIFENGVQTTTFPVYLNSNERITNVANGFTSVYDKNGHLIYFGFFPSDGLNIDIAANKNDDKNNPFVNAVGLNPYINYKDEVYPIQTLNNITKMYFGDPIIYTYNDHDFPIKKVAKDFNGGEEITTYEYLVKQN
jgi:hypothetical protein